MSLASLETRRVQPRYDSDIEDAEDFDDEVSADEEEDNSSNTTNDTDKEDGKDEASTSASEDDETNDLGEISFGALAKAQASFQPPHAQSRKRKRTSPGPADDDEEHKESSAPARWEPNKSWTKQDLSRTSKHAPAIQSTRNPVSRKRSVFSPPAAAQKSRDPRFDAPIRTDASRGREQDSMQTRKNYAFISEYQASEILDLKATLKRTKDADAKERLRAQLMSLEARLRNAESQRREAQIVAEHRAKEKTAIREGRKARAFYLKPSEIRKRVHEERQEAMSKGAREKAEKRKRKREKAKDAKDMPRVRRTA